MKKSGYNFFIATYGVLSCAATAFSIMTIYDIYKSDASTAKLISLLLYVEAAIYTCDRARTVWHDKNNQK